MSKITKERHKGSMALSSPFGRNRGAGYTVATGVGCAGLQLALVSPGHAANIAPSTVAAPASAETLHLDVRPAPSLVLEAEVRRRCNSHARGGKPGACRDYRKTA